MAAYSYSIGDYPSTVEFNTAVRTFKKEHDVKLKFLMEKDNPESIKLREIFLSNPLIKRYLSRTSQCVDFVDSHPSFETERKDKEHNDYYERRIYQLAGNQKWNFIPFRALVGSDTFFTSGVEKGYTESDSIKDPIYTLLGELGEGVGSVEDQDEVDIIREKLIEKQFLEGSRCRFFLTPIMRGSHLLPGLVISDERSKRPLAFIVISLENPDLYRYFSNIETIFRSTSAHCLPFHASNIQQLYDQFQLPLEGCQIDLEKREAVLLDRRVMWGTAAYSQDEVVKKVATAFDDHRVDVVHIIDPKDGRYNYKIVDRRLPSFIDASHNLQEFRPDSNCGLMTFNLLQAIGKLLEDRERSEDVYQLAKASVDGDEEEKEAAKKRLTEIFREDLKAYLPIYYHADGTRKSKEELQQFHLRQRWDLGSLALESDHYLRLKGVIGKA